MNYLEQAAGESLRNAAQETEELNTFCLIKPKLFKDGNEWCALYGDNLQEGVAGFGESPYKAAVAFREAWYNKL